MKPHAPTELMNGPFASWAASGTHLGAGAIRWAQGMTRTVKSATGVRAFSNAKPKTVPTRYGWTLLIASMDRRFRHATHSGLAVSTTAGSRTLMEIALALIAQVSRVRSGHARSKTNWAPVSVPRRPLEMTR